MSEKNDNKVPNVPNLRFGSSEVWTQTTIGKIAQVVGGGTPETDNLDYWNGNIQWFTPSEVGQTKYIEKSERTISVDGLNKSSAKLLPVGTLLLSTRATVGECSIALNECSTNQGFQSLIASDKVNNEFLYYLIATKKRHFVKYACGSTFLEISNKEVAKTKIFVPQQRVQEKIATFLSKIDQRIETQSKIINCLESLLKEISHHYFFGLNDTEIALSKIADIYQPKTISQSECSENGTYNVFGANGIIGKFNQYNHDLPQICITCRGSTSGNVFMTESYSWITGNAMVINIDKNLEIVNKTFLYYYLSSMSFKNIISGSGQPQIVREPLMKIKIKLPSLEEQLRFEKIINSFANKLQKEKDILVLYKKQKAYLLSNMFI